MGVGALISIVSAPPGRTAGRDPGLQGTAGLRQDGAMDIGEATGVAPMTKVVKYPPDLFTDLLGELANALRKSGSH